MAGVNRTAALYEYDPLGDTRATVDLALDLATSRSIYSVVPRVPRPGGLSYTP